MHADDQETRILAPQSTQSMIYGAILFAIHLMVLVWLWLSRFYHKYVWSGVAGWRGAAISDRFPSHLLIKCQIDQEAISSALLSERLYKLVSFCISSRIKWLTIYDVSERVLRMFLSRTVFELDGSWHQHGRLMMDGRPVFVNPISPGSDGTGLHICFEARPGPSQLIATILRSHEAQGTPTVVMHLVVAPKPDLVLCCDNELNVGGLNPCQIDFSHIE